MVASSPDDKIILFSVVIKIGTDKDHVLKLLKEKQNIFQLDFSHGDSHMNGEDEAGKCRAGYR